jgi:hypothetical protein
MSVRRGSLILVFGFLAGCAGPELPTDDASEAERVHPGGDENMARVTVSLPTGVCAPGGACGKSLVALPSLTIDGVAVSFDTVTRLVAGNHVLAVANGASDVFLASQNSIFTVAASEVKTITLAAARRICNPVGSVSVTPPSFGKVPLLSRNACPSVSAVASTGPSFEAQIVGGPKISAGSNCDSFDSFNSAYHNSMTRGAVTSTYYYYSDRDLCKAVIGSLTGAPYIDLVDGSRFIASVAAGTSCADLGGLLNFNTPATGTSRVDSLNASIAGHTSLGSFPFLTACATAQSLLGTSATSVSQWTAGLAGKLTFTNGVTSVDKTIGEGEVAEYTFDMGVVGTVPSTFDTVVSVATRELPTPLTASTCAIVASDGCGTGYSFSAATGSQSLRAYVYPECQYFLEVAGVRVAIDSHGGSYRIGRADVDDVTVRREDGTTYVTRGTYEVWQSGARVNGPFPTDSGVDLLPGSYEVRVTYTSLTGTKTDGYPLDVH